MTSTNIYQGMNTDNKPSSRVLAPPGGGSNNIFGASEPTPVVKRETAAPKPEVQQPAPPAQAERTIRAAPKQAFNPITGEPYGAPKKQYKEKEDDETTQEKENEQKVVETAKPVESAKPAEAREKTSTRIAQPPGGKSSGLW